MVSLENWEKKNLNGYSPRYCKFGFWGKDLGDSQRLEGYI